MSNRQPYGEPLPSGLQLYKVKLVGGPSDGIEHLTSCDECKHNGELYVRGKDDLYYHVPENERPPAVRLHWTCSSAIGQPYWQTVDIYECDECGAEFDTYEHPDEAFEKICSAECPRCHSLLTQRDDQPDIILPMKIYSVEATLEVKLKTGGAAGCPEDIEDAIRKIVMAKLADVGLADSGPYGMFSAEITKVDVKPA